MRKINRHISSVCPDIVRVGQDSELNSKAAIILEAFHLYNRIILFHPEQCL